MTYDEDEILDDIPPRLRDQVLQAWKVSQQLNEAESKPVYKHFHLKLTLAFLFGLLLTPVGILLCLTILFLPVGIFVIGTAAYPLSRVIRKKVLAGY